MSRIPADVLEKIRLDPPSVRLGLELILEDDRHPVSMDNALAFIQRLLDDSDGVEALCSFLNHRAGLAP